MLREAPARSSGRSWLVRASVAQSASDRLQFRASGRGLGRIRWTPSRAISKVLHRLTRERLNGHTQILDGRRNDNGRGRCYGLARRYHISPCRRRQELASSVSDCGTFWTWLNGANVAEGPEIRHQRSILSCARYAPPLVLPCQARQGAEMRVPDRMLQHGPTGLMLTGTLSCNLSRSRIRNDEPPAKSASVGRDLHARRVGRLLHAGGDLAVPSTVSADGPLELARTSIVGETA